LADDQLELHLMPTLALLAGPDGAGKTTFINGILRERAEAFRFVNPDDTSLLPAGEGGPEGVG
jgi:ABC-type branched-subunit amino acid transport system ATPase component